MKTIEEFLESISSNPKYNNCVFAGPGIYFVISNGSLWEISNDASCSPKGGWFPSIVSGPTADETKCLTSMMEALGFDEYFFNDIIDEYGEFSDEEVLEYFEYIERENVE